MAELEMQANNQKKDNSSNKKDVVKRSKIKNKKN